MDKRKITITFSRYNRFVFNKYYKKQRNDYTLNVDKIMKTKIEEDFVCMNKHQAFILNYEISRLLTKIIKDEKYDNIVYVNQNLSISSILNFRNFITKMYGKNIEFYYTMVYDDEDESLANLMIDLIPTATKKAIEF